MAPAQLPVPGRALGGAYNSQCMGVNPKFANNYCREPPPPLVCIGAIQTKPDFLLPSAQSKVHT